MCRSIHVLHDLAEAADDEAIRAAALQYVRKVSGMTRPSRKNTDAFERAVAEIAHITRHLLDELAHPAAPEATQAS